MSEVYFPSTQAFVLLSHVTIEYDIIYNSILECINSLDMGKVATPKLIIDCIHKYYESEKLEPVEKYLKDIIFCSVAEMSRVMTGLAREYGLAYYCYGFVIEA